MMNNKLMKCINCIYRDLEALTTSPNKRHLICRRYPPKISTEDAYPYGEYPKVLKEDWCGEFKCKENIEVK